MEPSAASAVSLAMPIRPGVAGRPVGRRLVGLSDGLPVPASREHAARGRQGRWGTARGRLACQPRIRGPRTRADGP
eukprot:gene1931-2735_t